MTFNGYGVWAIYRFEMARALRTLWQSVVTPVITTALYFVVFGGAIGSRMQQVDGVPYGAFIVPGLIMLSLFTQSIFNASFGIYFPKFTGTIYEILSAPVSPMEIVIAYVGAAATKSAVLGLIILVAGILYFNQFRQGLIDARVQSLTTQAQIIAFAKDYQMVMIFTLCTIPLAIMIGSTKAALRKQAAGPDHAVME